MLQKKIRQLKSASKFLVNDTLVKPIKYSMDFGLKTLEHIKKLVLDW